jgi:hypothetical protein
MSQQNVNLDNILDKKVRAKKSLIGSVEAKSESFILVASPAGTKYNVPRSHIERRAGNELLLDISYKELQRFKIK